ncbi:MAG: tRNA (N(6)-L-threonylcarbamoyladenosine(37)-C(2))-methylthiotransferase MtaB [Corallococcus sp.]|nr:tRNA (N(6)-L-threonylcarbamoyladenosine(37)-C(2))-methylthiotransferase MtaB [Corallococcus sp.]
MTISVFTLGCKTNLYESGQIIDKLNNSGHKAFHGLKCADVFVLNTCAITKEAEKKSRQAIARARKLNPDCRVIITGCASQKDANQFADISNVTLISGIASKTKIAEEIERAGIELSEVPSEYEECGFAAQERTRAFVKIQDGCNNFCSYCIVPYLRGRSRSRRIADVVKELNNIDSAEAVLIGIDISQFGNDTGESLTELFEAIRGNGVRIRLGSLEARAVTDGLLKSLSKINFCPHFHLSLQSGCTATLKRMNRKYTAEEYYDAVRKIRKVFPDAGITTDVIVGFCGETDGEFATTVDFVKKVQFADIHVFPYSPREGTVSYGWQDVPSNVKNERARILGEVKRELKRAFAEKFVDKTVSVLCERKRNGLNEGYSKEYLRVYFEGNVKVNGVVNVKITAPYLDGAKGELV